MRGALHFVLPYATGGRDWKADYPTASSEGNLSWTSLAHQLRIAVVALDNSTYEGMIPDLEAGFDAVRTLACPELFGWNQTCTDE